MTDLKRTGVHSFEIVHDPDDCNARPRPTFDTNVEEFWRDVVREHGADVRGRLDLAFRGMTDDIDRPWAILVLDRDYRIGGHLAELRRRKRHLHIQCFKTASWEAICSRGDVAVSILLVRRKHVLAELSDRSPILGAAWELLRHHSERRRWIAFLPSFSPELEAELSTNNIERYRAAQASDVIAESKEALADDTRWRIWRHSVAQALADGELEAAEAILERIVEPPGDPVYPSFLLGKIRRRLGDYAGALPYLEHALQKSPRHVESQLEWARCHMEQDSATEALAGFERALALDPFDEEAWAEMGVLLKKTGDVDGAVAALSRAVQINGESSSAWATLALVLYEANRYEESALAFEQATLLDPESAVCWNDAAYLRALAGDPDKALPLCRRALALDPGLCAAWDSLGFILHRLGRLQEAREAFAEGLRIKPQHEPCAIHLADLIKDIHAQAAHCLQPPVAPS